ncbi:unnamed protein product, partial [Rotaria sp. Silwood1]
KNTKSTSNQKEKSINKLSETESLTPPPTSSPIKEAPMKSKITPPPASIPAPPPPPPPSSTSPPPLTKSKREKP